MADVAVPAPAAAAVKPKKAARKSTGGAKAKKTSDHPKYAQMVKDALTALKERGGSSRQAILKYIVKQYKLAGEEKTINAHLKLALRAGVKNGTLKQSKGTGAAGSFRLGEKKTGEKKPKVAKAKKPAAAKKTTTKKPKATGSPKKKAAKPKVAKPKTVKPKTVKPKAAAKPKSPKKAKAAKPAKPKSPKKVAKPKTAKAKKAVKK